MPNVTEITDAQFEAEVVQSKVPVVVDFFATWCPPCQRLAPILEELAGTYSGRAKFVKLNTDKEQKWASKLGVRSLPTLAYYKDGQPLTAEAGLVSPNRVKELIDKML